ncbi:TraR/DksA family transcriptional regulator [Rhodobacteraceae bacterium CCMM004]|nr:TraR/DksA family transcriptional regulator [Rhodobacteraceae bacterium CCMM004]
MDPDDARERLRARSAALVAETNGGRGATATVALDQQAVGRLSRMDALQQQAMAQAAQRNRAAELGRIDAALARIAANAFGYCVDCGDEIAAARLDRDPSAPKCLSCARG